MIQEPLYSNLIIILFKKKSVDLDKRMKDKSHLGIVHSNLGLIVLKKELLLIKLNISALKLGVQVKYYFVLFNLLGFDLRFCFTTNINQGL